MKGKRLCFFCLRHNANYRAPSSARLNSFKRQTMCEEFNANFRKLIQFMLSLSKYLGQTTWMHADMNEHTSKQVIIHDKIYG